jgi:hypothetical protein
VNLERAVIIVLFAVLLAVIANAVLLHGLTTALKGLP